MDLQQAFDRGFEAVKKYVDAELSLLKSQLIVDVECLQPLPGPPGQNGDKGEPGAKGEAGRDGRDAADLPLLKSYAAELVAVGIEAVFKAMTITTPDSGRTLVVAVGEKTWDIKTAIPLDVGVWADGNNYQAGDAVSHGGSLFIAKDNTAEKPGNNSGAWRLAVKRGNDGRDNRGPFEPAPGGGPALTPIRFK